MNRKTGLGTGIVLTILAFIIGLTGIATLIGVGEAVNNVFAAFAAVSFPFSLVAGVLSWFAPRARWAIGVAVSVPVAILSIVGAWSSSFLIPGAIWTMTLTCAGAYLGAHLRESRSRSPRVPPS